MKIFSCALAARERLATLALNLGRQTLEGMAPSLRPALLLDRFGRAEAFMGQWARAPRSVGALCPSGVHLARRMPPCCRLATAWWWNWARAPAR